MAWIWTIVLASSLVSVVGFARAGSVLFWKAHSVHPSGGDAEAEGIARPSAMSYAAVGGLLALLVAHTVFAGQVHAYTTAMAAELFAHETYISTVLDTPGKLSTPKEGY